MGERKKERERERERRCPHHDDGEEQFSLEVVELRHLGQIVQRVIRVHACLRVQVRVASVQLRGSVLSQVQVLKLTRLLQLSLSLLRDSE